MKTLNQQYEAAKQKALNFMQTGQIAAYLKALSEMNNYKKLMNAVVYN